MDRKGQARILEIGMMLVVALLGAVLLGSLTSDNASIVSNSKLKNLGYQIIRSLDENGLLFQALYGEDGNGEPELLREELQSYIPSYVGFNATVVDKKMNKIFSVVSPSYDATNAISVVFFYYGKDGVSNPRVLILCLSSNEKP